MEPEASSFESSEMLANYVASSPLLSESWRLCYHITTATSPSIPSQSFVMKQVGSIGYVAFSSIISEAEADFCCCNGNLVALDDQFFSPLNKQINEGEEEPVLVHAGFLQLFFSIYASPSFQTQMMEIIQKSKSIVITGHSVRATTASLSTLWLLSHLQRSNSPSLPILCITFGSPLLGNESLSRAILRERWDGNFCHVVSKHDIMPRLLFVPPLQFINQLKFLLNFWHLSMTSPQFQALATQLNNEEKAEIFRFVMGRLEVLAQAEEAGSATRAFWPFGSYFFCSEEGAICIDNATSVIKMMHLMLMTGSPCASIGDHLMYGDYIRKISYQFLKRRNSMHGDIPESCYEAGVALALQSSAVSSQEPVATAAKDCLKMARRMGRTPNLNVADLAIKLSRINPYRAQIEWYKACCDESDEQMGYYDSFKLRGVSKRDSKVNMNRIMLGKFWDGVIDKLENNDLPHDFHRRGKWVNASQFYMLLVEPLDIAEYYRNGLHRSKGHYVKHGRPRRYEIFERWWKERRISDEKNNNRSRLASSTQDSCFWAELEEARECLDSVRSESDPNKLDLLWQNINNFEKHAVGLVESKQVSRDVLARNSSYVSWVDDLRELRSQLWQFSVKVPTLVNGELVP